MPGQRKLAIVAAYAVLCVVWSSTWLAIKVGLLDRSRTPAAGPPVGLLPARLYWTAYVRLKLPPALLGRKVCVIRFGGGVAGHHPDLRNALRPSASAGGADALATLGWRIARPRRRRAYLRPLARPQRHAGVLGRPGHRVRGGWRGILKCAFETARPRACPGHACGVANVLRHHSVDRARVRRRWQPGPVPLERNGVVLPALSGGDRIGADLSPSLLALAAHDRNKSTNHLPHHAARRGRLWMVSWR